MSKVKSFWDSYKLIIIALIIGGFFLYISS